MGKWADTYAAYYGEDAAEQRQGENMARNYRIDTEAGAQEAIFSWCDIHRDEYPELKLLYHIPNGGQRNKSTAIALKRQGVKAGVPDLCLPVARGGFHGLYIELKRADKSNRATEKQKGWINKLKEQNYYATVAYGYEAAIQELIAYLSLPRMDDIAGLMN